MVALDNKGGKVQVKPLAMNTARQQYRNENAKLRRKLNHQYQSEHQKLKKELQQQMDKG